VHLDAAPVGPRKTRNIVEFYYPEEIALFEREFVEAERAAYGNVRRGRRDRRAHGRRPPGADEARRQRDRPLPVPMEDGMQHFHEWYRRVMDYSSVTGVR
jgi:hypothetical protein